MSPSSDAGAINVGANGNDDDAGELSAGPKLGVACYTRSAKVLGGAGGRRLGATSIALFCILFGSTPKEFAINCVWSLNGSGNNCVQGSYFNNNQYELLSGVGLLQLPLRTTQRSFLRCYWSAASVSC